MKENMYQINSPAIKSLAELSLDIGKTMFDDEVSAALAEADRRYLHW